MDESLSDFQEKKKSCKGPKESKASGSKPKPKKPIKRIRGQKDIRTALRSKKNDLIAYTEEFNTVCSETGVDVDSEQLQLAIALSKSLQEKESTSESSSQSLEPLTSQERIGRIRTTLLEYGFKVPEIKITATNKRLRKHRKNHRLLQATEEEKQQLISDRYAQILFEIVDSNITSELTNLPNAPLYNIATNTTYEVLKNNDILYVEGLIEKSTSDGCLLRDWSEIPGRPVSPKQFEHFRVKFNELETSQSELDRILSGPLVSAKEILKRKLILDGERTENDDRVEDKCVEESDNKVIVYEITDISDYNKQNEQLERSIKSENVMELAVIDAVKTEITVVENSSESKMSQSDKLINTVVYQSPKQAHQNELALHIDTQNKVTAVRSCSPDLFDDEVSSIIENTKENIVLSQDQVYKTIAMSNDFMDLTECANTASQNTGCHSNKENTILGSQTSQKSNTTKCTTNDFMEITDCVASSSQPILVNVEENIDLTQNSDNNDKEITVVMQEDNNKHVDLTQSSNSDDELPEVVISGTQKQLDDTVLLQDNEESSINESKDNTIILKDDELMSINEPKSPVTVTINEPVENLVCEDNLSEPPIDLTGEINVSPSKTEESQIKTNTTSFFDEFVHAHSDESPNEDVSINENSSSNLNKSKECSRDNNDIDLTQTSDSSIETNLDSVNRIKCPLLRGNSNSLGKKDDVSIDYDEIQDNVDYENHPNENSNVECNNSYSKSVDYDEIDKNLETSNQDAETHSQHSEVFEISDKELDYSVQKSKHENFNFGGISVIDEINPSFCRSKNSFSNSSNSNINKKSIDVENNINIVNNTCNNESLPIVDIRKDTAKVSKQTESTDVSTPIKNINIAFKTPQNSEYLIKTNNVTPMLDYESMTTPERNKELEKYGVKPFKRKRAIQLLKHLYEQTHPVVESYEDLPSPLKKFKPDTTPTKPSSSKTTISPKKKRQATPKKTVKSPAKSPILNSQFVDQDNVYVVTNECPVIKHLECKVEDWVFQKREKAKVHSCRLPLHIAFHNYVSCRRGLHEAILQYEPINIDIVHKEMIASGHRYDPKELLKFLDKKCITVKTMDNNARNNKK